MVFTSLCVYTKASCHNSCHKCSTFQVILYWTQYAVTYLLNSPKNGVKYARSYHDYSKFADIISYISQMIDFIHWHVFGIVQRILFGLSWTMSLWPDSYHMTYAMKKSPYGSPLIEIIITLKFIQYGLLFHSNHILCLKSSNVFKLTFS